MKAIIKFVCVILVLIILAAVAFAGKIVVKNGNLNVSDDLFADTSTLFVDSGGNKVGIGIVTPNHKLEVAGSINASQINSSGTFCIGGKCVDSWDDINVSVSSYDDSGLWASLEAVNDSLILENASMLRNSTDILAGNFCLGARCIDSWDDVNGSIAEAYTGTLNGLGSSGKIALWNGTESLNDSVITQLNGNIGIAETNPTEELQINGDVLISSTTYRTLTIDTNAGSFFYADRGGVTSGGGIGFKTAGTQKWFAGLSRYGGTDDFRIIFGATDNIYPAFIIDSSQNVGIGTNVTNHKLEIAGSMNASQINASGTFCLGGKCVDSWDDVNVSASSYDDSAIIANYTLNKALIDNLNNTKLNKSEVPTHLSNLSFDIKVGNTSTEVQSMQAFWNATDINGTQFCLGVRCIDDWDDVNVSGSSYDDSGLWASLEAVNSSLILENATIVRNSTDAYFGNVGIGTDSPGQALEVIGNANITSLYYSGAILYDGSGASVEIPVRQADYVTNDDNGNMYMGRGDGSSYPFDTWGNLIIQARTSQLRDIVFASADSAGGSLSAKMVISSGGNVGIGTTSPNQKLEVNGSVNATNINASRNILVGDKIGIGIEPVANVDVSSATTTQLKLRNASVSAEMSVSENGNFTIRATDGNVIIRLG